MSHQNGKVPRRCSPNLISFSDSPRRVDYKYVINIEINYMLKSLESGQIWHFHHIDIKNIGIKIYFFQACLLRITK